MMNNLLHKVAAELPDQKQFEQDFSNIALTFLKDRATELVDYLVGFEIVARPEEGDKAVGILGFIVGDRAIYVPAFWYNNQLSGMDLLFNKEQDQFYPLTENWVSRIISASSRELGEAADVPAKSIDSARWYENIIRPPGTQGTKNASAEYEVDNFTAAWAHMTESITASLTGDAKFAEQYRGAIESMTAESDYVFDKEASSILISYLKEVGGPEAVAQTLGNFKNAQWADAALAFYDPEDLMIDTFSSNLAPKVVKTAAVKEIKVLTGESSNLTDAEAEKVIRDGFDLRDGRDDSDKAEGHDIVHTMLYQSPTSSGTYRVRLFDGETEECFVGTAAKPDKSAVGRSYRDSTEYMPVSESFIIRDLEGSGKVFKGRKVKPCDLFVEPTETAEDGRNDLFDKAIDLTKFVSFSYKRSEKSSDGSVPPCSDDGLTIAVVNPMGDICELAPYASSMIKVIKRDGHAVLQQGYSTDTMRDVATFLTGLRSKDIRTMTNGNSYAVPAEHWRLVIIEEDVDVFSHTGGLMPGLEKIGMHELTITTGGFDGSYNISNALGIKISCSTAPEAAYCLAEAFKLPGEFACNVVKQATDKGTKTFMYKEAATVTPPEMPQDAPQGWDQQVGAVVQPQYMEQTEGNTIAASPRDTSAGSGINVYQQPHGPGASADSASASPYDLATQAAESGQKQVFDHSSIGSLAVNYSVTEVVDSYIVDMYKTMDRLGRIIFLLHWEPEDFAERYGTNDVQLLKTRLRTVFKGLGDLILKLQQSSNEIGTSGMSIGGA